MTTLAAQDIPVSVNCVGATAVTVPAGISTYFQNAQYLLFGCWFKATRRQDGATFRDMLIFRGDSGSGQFAGLFLNPSTETIAIDGLGISSPSANVVMNTWTYAVGELDIPNLRARIWINGIKVADAAIVLARNLITVNSFTSFIGDSGAPGFEGMIGNAFILNRNAAATNEEIYQLYVKGHYPTCRIGFVWELNEGNGTLTQCVNEDLQIGITQSLFNGTLSANTMWRSDTPLKGRFIDRPVNASVFMNDGAAGSYAYGGTEVHRLLTGKRVVGISAFIKYTGKIITAATRMPFNVTNNAGSQAIAIGSASNGNTFFGGRSADGDAFQQANVINPSHYNVVDPGNWHKVECLLDCQGKIVNGYVDGILCAQLTAAAFGQNTWQCTPNASAVLIGHPGFPFPGYVSDCQIYYANAMPTAKDMRAWYLSNKAPLGVTQILQIDCNDVGPNLTDKLNFAQPNITFTPTGIVSPYGISGQGFGRG